MTANRGRHLDQYLVAIGELARLAANDAKNLPIMAGSKAGLALESIAHKCESAQLSTQPDDNMEGLLRATIDLVESVLVLTKDGTQRHAPQKKTLRSVIKSLSDTLP